MRFGEYKHRSLARQVDTVARDESHAKSTHPDRESRTVATSHGLRLADIFATDLSALHGVLDLSKDL